MKLRFLQTYSKSLTRIDNVLVALHQITHTEPVFTDNVNVSVNRPLEIKALRQVTLINGSTHYVSAKLLNSLIDVETPYGLQADDNGE